MTKVTIRWGGRTNLQRGVQTVYENVSCHTHDRELDLLEIVNDEGRTTVNLKHAAAWTVAQ